MAKKAAGSGKRGPEKSRARRRQGGKRHKRAQRSAVVYRRSVQAVVCGGIFVLLVAVKLLSPTGAVTLRQELSAALEKNMDVQAVFSAVAQIAGGEKDGKETLDEVYRAVFGEQPAEEPSPPRPASEAVRAVEGSAIRELRREREAAEGGSEEGEDLPLNCILYSDENLPEKVSMEQALLGFSYCSPVEGAISSPFGYRQHPVEGAERFHYGIDLAAEQGEPIRCFADGVVKAVGESSSYGKYAIVSHAGGFDSLYAHCSRILVSAGSELPMGEVLGEVGDTGMATGPHLHFELTRDGVYLNPIYYVN